mmetsp:Transcript_554/g.2164  ORF Transcript_554/g.2164 Transcript_554/m.2164 type:complete len:206 (-) Transcript_554:78-695(-)
MPPSRRRWVRRFARTPARSRPRPVFREPRRSASRRVSVPVPGETRISGSSKSSFRTPVSSSSLFCSLCAGTEMGSRRRRRARETTRSRACPCGDFPKRVAATATATRPSRRRAPSACATRRRATRCVACRAATSSTSPASTDGSPTTGRARCARATSSRVRAARELHARRRDVRRRESLTNEAKRGDAIGARTRATTRTRVRVTV